MPKNKYSEEEFLDNTLSYINMFEAVVDPEIDENNKDEQYYRDIKTVKYFDEEIARLEGEFNKNGYQKILEELNYAKERRNEIVKQILRVYELDKKLKALDPQLVESLRKAVKFYFPYMSFNRISVDAIDPKTEIGQYVLEKIKGVNIVEEINKCNVNVERALFRIVQPVFDFVVFRQNIKSKKSVISKDEIAIVVNTLQNFVKHADCYDIDFSKYDEDKCKPEDFYKNLLSENTEALQLFANITNVNIDVAKEYIGIQKRMKKNEEELERQAKEIEAVLDARQDREGYYDPRIEDLSNEFNESYSLFLTAKQKRLNSMLTIDELAQMSTALEVKKAIAEKEAERDNAKFGR